LGALFKEKVKNIVYIQELQEHEIEKKTKKLVKVLRSHKDGEYISNEFNNYS
jgi:hypothetical protein